MNMTIRTKLSLCFACALIIGTAIVPAAQAAGPQAPGLLRAVADKDLAGVTAALQAAGLESEYLDEYAPDMEDAFLVYESNYLAVLCLRFPVETSTWVFVAEPLPGQEHERIIGFRDLAPQATPFSEPATLQDGSVLLPVRSRPGSGSGVYLASITWFLFNRDTVATVLDYPLEGAVVGWGLSYEREFSSLTTYRGESGGQFAVEATFSATFSNGLYEQLPGLGELFSYEEPVRFVLDPGTKTFAVDPAHSGLTMDQIQGLFNDAEDGFLEHNTGRLSQLATQGTDEQRQWLRLFLDACSDSPAKTDMLKLLDAK